MKFAPLTRENRGDTPERGWIHPESRATVQSPQVFYLERKVVCHLRFLTQI